MGSAANTGGATWAIQVLRSWHKIGKKSIFSHNMGAVFTLQTKTWQQQGRKE